ncbi:MAG: hypothetical protein AB7I04_14270 [Pseudomonadales bacterium]
MTKSTTVRCNGIPYRQGILEVRHDMHPGFINLECWMLDPAIDITRLEPAAAELPDSAVIANTELELSLAQAGELVRLLQEAIRMVER